MAPAAARCKQGDPPSACAMAVTRARVPFKVLDESDASLYVASMGSREFIHVTYGEPHAGRGREILAAHPELRALGGHTPSSALWGAGVVALQFAMAVGLRGRPWYIWAPCAYVVGATADHAIWALIHETSHNLIFRGRTANRLMAIFLNLPLVAPAAISFNRYHILHHRHMGEMDWDAGVPGPVEAARVGDSSWVKTFWLAFYFWVTGIIRPHRIKKLPFMDGWTAINTVVQVAAMVALGWFAGPDPFKYLVAATIFAIGLHPVGARWVQEHFALAPGQETYSYYGPLNKVAFNVGYHNEHHDLVNVPWSRLPRIRKMAPEFYDTLQSYESWTGLLIRFIRDRQITLYRYIVRPSRGTPDAG